MIQKEVLVDKVDYCRGILLQLLEDEYQSIKLITMEIIVQLISQNYINLS